MSDTKKLNEGIVDALADTDLVLAADASGKLRPVTLDNLLAAVRGSIKVGGRNLLQGTSETPYSYTGTKYYTLSSPLTLGETVLVSFDIDWEGSKPYMEIYTADKIGQSISERNLIDSKTVVKGHNDILLPTVKPADKFCIFTNSATPITVSRVKIERGNIPTDWSPAPEDVLAKSGGGKTRTISCLHDCSERRCAA